jgi:DNA-binding transcriptional regulator WhiA
MGHIQNKDPNFMQSKCSSDFKPYIIGMMLGDGHLGKPKNRSHRIILGLKDKDFIYKLHPIFCPTRKIYFGKPKKETHSPSYVLQNINKDAISELRKYGMIERKSNILKYPHQFSKKRSKGLSHFIRGYFDANGSIFKNNVKGHTYKHISISVGSLDFAEGLKKVLIDVGFTVSIVNEKRHKAYYVKIYKKDEIVRFSQWIYKGANWYIERKHHRFYNDIV